VDRLLWDEGEESSRTYRRGNRIIYSSWWTGSSGPAGEVV
jgi:hypothetical protein